MSSYNRICAFLHAPGSNKPGAFKSSHGPNATRLFNTLIRKTACRRPFDSFFNPYSVTFNASSIDGQHYKEEANLLLAQLLLNHLRTVVLA